MENEKKVASRVDELQARRGYLSYDEVVELKRLKMMSKDGIRDKGSQDV